MQALEDGVEYCINVGAPVHEKPEKVLMTIHAGPGVGDAVAPVMLTVKLGDSFGVTDALGEGDSDDDGSVPDADGDTVPVDESVGLALTFCAKTIVRQNHRLWILAGISHLLDRASRRSRAQRRAT